MIYDKIFAYIGDFHIGWGNGSRAQMARDIAMARIRADRKTPIELAKSKRIDRAQEAELESRSKKEDYARKRADKILDHKFKLEDSDQEMLDKLATNK